MTSLGSTRVGFADLTTALFPTALDAVVSGDDDFGHGRVVGELRLRAHYQRAVPNQPKLERCVAGLFPLLGCFPSGTADGGRNSHSHVTFPCGYSLPSFPRRRLGVVHFSVVGMELGRSVVASASTVGVAVSLGNQVYEAGAAKCLGMDLATCCVGRSRVSLAFPSFSCHPPPSFSPHPLMHENCMRSPPFIHFFFFWFCSHLPIQNPLALRLVLPCRLTLSLP